MAGDFCTYVRSSCSSRMPERPAAVSPFVILPQYPHTSSCPSIPVRHPASVSPYVIPPQYPRSSSLPSIPVRHPASVSPYVILPQYPRTSSCPSIPIRHPAPVWGGIQWLHSCLRNERSSLYFCIQKRADLFCFLGCESLFFIWKYGGLFRR